jgi:hypothetical protein
MNEPAQPCDHGRWRRRPPLGRWRAAAPVRRARVDVSPEGLRAAELRVAQPVAPLSVERLAELGLDAETLRTARSWRKAKWIDRGLERLDRLELIDRRWDRARIDQFIDVRRPRRLGHEIIAAACVPSVRGQLDVLWDAMHEYGAGAFWCGDFLGAFFGHRP